MFLQVWLLHQIKSFGLVHPQIEGTLHPKMTKGSFCPPPPSPFTALKKQERNSPPKHGENHSAPPLVLIFREALPGEHDSGARGSELVGSSGRSTRTRSEWP